MPGNDQFPPGAEFAAALSLIWALSSWICSSLLLWLAWSHHEGWSYLALVAVSSLISNTFSIVQQGHDISWYTEVVQTQFQIKQQLPANDPELAIAGGSYGLDLGLYYIQYYSYNVQAMLVMFWAAELCQLTYRVGERRKIRQMFRKVHTTGKFISWLLPLATILCLRIPSLRLDFVAFLLVADLPLMLSLAIGSGLMIAVTIRYVQSRQKFTQWSPPKFNSANSGSDGGTYTSGTQNSARPSNSGSAGMKGLYDRWLMVRFTIAFILLAVFEVTNTLFQVTALQNNINDATATAPDLSAGRAIQTFFLFMPGTSPGIALLIVFGTTRNSRKKMGQLLPGSWRQPNGLLAGLCSCFGRNSQQSAALPERTAKSKGGIRVQTSLTVMSAVRTQASRIYDEGDLSEASDIWMKNIPMRSQSAVSFQASHLKPLPLLPPSSRHASRTAVSSPPTRSPVPLSAFNTFSEMGKHNSKGEALSRTSTAESLHAPDDYYRTTGEHSDDSGPILPIQRPEVRFSADVVDAVRRASGRDRSHARNFSRPKS